MLKLKIFLCILLAYVVVAIYNQAFILTDNFINSIIGDKLNSNNVNETIIFVRKWQWLSYIFIPIFLLLRISFCWVCLKGGSFITEQFTDTPFWKICILAETVFAFGAMIGVIYTEFYVDLESIEQLSVNPFSLHVFTSSNTPKWSEYFFNTLNVFEVSYVFFLAYLISEESKKSFMYSLSFVATTYVPALLLWILLVSYFSLMFQP